MNIPMIKISIQVMHLIILPYWLGSCVANLGTWKDINGKRNLEQITLGGFLYMHIYFLTKTKQYGSLVLSLLINVMTLTSRWLLTLVSRWRVLILLMWRVLTFIAYKNSNIIYILYIVNRTWMIYNDILNLEYFKIAWICILYYPNYPKVHYWHRLKKIIESLKPKSNSYHRSNLILECCTYHFYIWSPYFMTFDNAYQYMIISMRYFHQLYQYYLL